VVFSRLSRHRTVNLVDVNEGYGLWSLLDADQTNNTSSFTISTLALHHGKHDVDHRTKTIGVKL
jgi:hypothetical protein